MIVSNNKEVGQVYRGTKQVKRFYKGEDIIHDSVLNYENFTNNTCDINGFISNEIPKSLHIPDKICVMDAKKTAKTYKIHNIAFDSAEGVESVFLGSNTNHDTVFSGSGFTKCSTLNTVSIGNSVKSIGDNMFNECVNLKRVNVGKNLNEIGGFMNCSNLTGVIPDHDTVNVTKIYPQAFYGCGKLKNIRILEKVEFVGSQAFYACESLEKLDFPTRVLLGPAFQQCRKLREISFNGGLDFNSTIWFQDCEALTTINYNDPQKSWKALTKPGGWDYNTGDYTVYCCEFNSGLFTTQEVTIQGYGKKNAYGWDTDFENMNLIDLKPGDKVDVIFNDVRYSDLTVKFLGNSATYYGVGGANIFDPIHGEYSPQPFVLICNRNFISGEYYGATIMTMVSWTDTTLKVISKIKKT